MWTRRMYVVQCVDIERKAADNHWQMRIRHSSILNAANFLQTATEPKLVRLLCSYHAMTTS